MKDSAISSCIRIAKSNLKKHPIYLFHGCNSYIHYSFVFQGKLIEWGTNRNGNPPIHFGYNERIEGANAKIHSEFDAWKKARGLLRSDKSFECFNVRLNRRGEIRLSMPCKCCYSFLKNLGCKRFYFTTNFGIGSVVC